MTSRIFRELASPNSLFFFSFWGKKPWRLLVFLEEAPYLGFGDVFFWFWGFFSSKDYVYANYNWIAARGIKESFWVVVQRYQKWEQNNLILKYLVNFLEFQCQELCFVYFILKRASHLSIMHNSVVLLLKVKETMCVIDCLSFLTISFS